MPRIEPLNQNEINEETREAFEQHVKDYQSRITNMKATMGKSLLVFDVYMQWYDLYKDVKFIVGERAAYLFAHAISLSTNCPLCTTYFRKIIIDNGEKPEDLVLSEDEQTLLDFGNAIANNKGEVDDELYAKIAAKYAEEDIIVLVGFAGQMIATNIFNNALQVQVDEYLANYVSVKA